MPAIEVRGVRKAFRLPHERQTTLTERLLSLFRGVPFENFEALRGIDVAIEHGSFVGIIGRNGSGKSTLLKIMAGLLVPDEGSVKVRGTVCALLELGLGFSAELTVYENVELYAAVLGFPRTEILARIEHAIDFAGLQRFRDAKLKNLSTGMRARLGFATALQAESDILLLDEILAVGDVDFQEKCHQTFAALKRQRKTVVLVTHDLGSVRRLCDRAILVDQGGLVVAGDSDRVVERYLQLVGHAPPAPTAVIHGNQPRRGDGRIRFVAGWLEDEQGSPVTSIRSGQHPTLVLRVEVHDDTVEPVFGLMVTDQTGSPIYVTNTLQLRISSGTLLAGQTAEVRVPFTAGLRNGRYQVTPGVADQAGTSFHDRVENLVGFEVSGSHCLNGVADLNASFSCEVVDGRSVSGRPSPREERVEPRKASTA